MGRACIIEKLGLQAKFIEIFNKYNGVRQKTADELSEISGQRISRQNVDWYWNKISNEKNREKANKKKIAEANREVKNYIQTEREKFVFYWQSLIDIAKKQLTMILKNDDLKPQQKLFAITNMINNTLNRSFNEFKIGMPPSAINMNVDKLTQQYEVQVNNISQSVLKSCCNECKGKIQESVRSLQAVSIQTQ